MKLKKRHFDTCGISGEIVNDKSGMKKRLKSLGFKQIAKPGRALHAIIKSQCPQPRPNEVTIWEKNGYQVILLDPDNFAFSLFKEVSLTELNSLF